VDEAAAAFEELLADRLRVLGPNHPDTLTTRHEIARWRGELDYPETASAELAKVLAAERRIFDLDSRIPQNTRDGPKRTPAMSRRTGNTSHRPKSRK
jgi:hypothetical protein